MANIQLIIGCIGITVSIVFFIKVIIMDSELKSLQSKYEMRDVSKR